MSVHSETSPVPVCISATPTSASSSSELLYGHFIELGYGLQVDSMRSEMLFNPGFTPFVPYRPIAIEWFDLWNDRDDHARGFETDWSVYDWYHSGYEHNAWYAAPGPTPDRLVRADSTFIVCSSPEIAIDVEQRDVGGRRGTTGLEVTNRGADRWGGIAQSSLWLTPEGRYRYRIRVRAGAGASALELRLHGDGEWQTAIDSVRLGVPGADWTEYTGELSASGYRGRATLLLATGPSSGFVVDEVSLATSDQQSGWRTDAIAATRRVNPGVIRWPGGCAASLYDWHDGIGPVGARPARGGHFWGGLEDNAIGVDELAALADLLGAASMICVNMHHPLKVHLDSRLGDGNPHGFVLDSFGDHNAGIAAAADLVAYCNLPSDGAHPHPMAALRARNGYPAPFGVRFWEMDNEPVRWFGQDEYALAVAEYSQAMKAVDPTIEIGIVTYAWDAGGGSNSVDAIPELLAIAGDHVDFLADRGFGEEDLRAKLTRLRAFNSERATSIRYCNTEWLAYDGVADEQNRRDTADMTKSSLFGSWRYALNIARHFLMWQRYGEEILFVNFNNLANTHAQNVLDTAKEGVGLSAAGRVFELISRSPARRPLLSSGAEPAHDADFQIQASWDETETQLVLTAVSLLDEDRSATIDLSSLSSGFTRMQTTTLSADGPLARDHVGHLEQIARDSRLENVTGATLDITVQAWSLTQIVLS